MLINPHIKELRKAKFSFISKVKALRDTAIDKFKSVVSSLPESDDTLKYINKLKAAKWSKVGTALDKVGAFFDAITIGVNAWAFDSARKAGNDAGMASSGLSMAAGKFDSQTTFQFRESDWLSYWLL